MMATTQQMIDAIDENRAVRNLLRDLGFAIGEGFLVETWVYDGFVWFEMGGKLQYKTWENNEHGKWHEYTNRREFLAWFLEALYRAWR